MENKMTNDKIFKLILRIRDKTRIGEVEWESTANSNNFATSLVDYSVIISEKNQDYVLYIINSDDEVVEMVSDAVLSLEYGDAYIIMKSLFESARRSARGSDKAIDDILNFLD